MEMLYDKKYLIRYCLFLALTLFVLKFTNGMAFGGIALVLLASARGKAENYLFCLLTACAMMMTNSWFFSKNMIFAVSQRLFVVSLAVIMVTQIAGRRNSRYLTPFLGVLVYLVYMMLPSFMGWNPTISFLKILLFVMVFFAYYGVCNRALVNMNSTTPRIRSVFLSFAAYFVLGSILLIPFPAISVMGLDEFLPGELPVSLFKGMTVHSQSLGPAITSIAVVVFADFIFSIRRPDKLYLLLLLACPILVYKTSSRTAMGALLVGVAFATFVFMRARNVGAQWRGRVIGGVAALALVLMVLMLSIGSIRDRAITYIMKFDQDARSSDVSFANVTSTRQGAMEESLRNFKESPAIGNGFQVTRFYKGMRAQRISQLLSAPIEKGVWITAILEEGGVFGMLIFLGFAGFVLLKLYIVKAYIGCSMFFTMLVLNLGEFTIFSLTAVGGLIWFCVFVGVVLDGLRIKQEAQQAMTFKPMFAPPPQMVMAPFRSTARSLGRM